MDPTTPPTLPPLPQAVPQALPLPQPGAMASKVMPPVAGGPTASTSGEGPTVDEAPGDAAVQLSFWQHPFVQNVMPLLTSLVLHATLIVVAITSYKVVQAVNKVLSKDQVTIPDATMNEGPEGGIPHPGLGGDPNRDAAQDKFMDVPKESQGINDKPGKDLAAALSGGGSGDSSDGMISVSLTGAGLGSGKGAGTGKGDGSGGGSGDGGALAPFGIPGGGGGLGPKSSFVGVPGYAKKIVYVLDATGSMMTSFDNLRVQLRTSIMGLRPPQSFDIVFINEHNPAPLAPSLLFTTPENKRKAQEYVDTMAPRGATDPVPAITKAFELQPELIFLLIDPSDFPDKQSVINLIAKQNQKAKIKLNIIAFEGHDPENEAFLKKLASDSGGSYKYVSSADLANQ